MQSRGAPTARRGNLELRVNTIIARGRLRLCLGSSLSWLPLVSEPTVLWAAIAFSSALGIISSPSRETQRRCGRAESSHLLKPLLCRQRLSCSPDTRSQRPIVKVTVSPTFTREQILALAPDVQVAAAGQSLAQPGKWQAVGCDETTAWGSQQGSGSNPYQVAIDFDGPAFKCTCPSRKRPCKHALGLFLLVTHRPQVASQSARPDWVQEWSADRVKTAERAAAKAQKGEATGDSAATAGTAEQPARSTARQVQREKRVQEGVATLARWLEDLVRQGLGSAAQQPPASGRARPHAWWTRRRPASPAGCASWPGFRTAARAGRLACSMNWRNCTSCSKGMPACTHSHPACSRRSARRSAGRRTRRPCVAEVAVRDRWLVVGTRVTEEDRLRVQRTWLWGASEQAAALVLDFAPPGRPIECALMPGTAWMRSLSSGRARSASARWSRRNSRSGRSATCLVTPQSVPVSLPTARPSRQTPGSTVS